jgi:hypothetical protein
MAICLGGVLDATFSREGLYEVGAAGQLSLLGRPADVAATMGNSPKRYNGAYTSSGVARMCGETDPLQSFTGERAFIVEFPLDYNGGSIVDVRFRSRTLVGFVRQTGGFFVSVTVKAAIGGQPPAYVVDTERPAPGNSGTASLSVKDGVATLRVQASDSLGQTLQLQITCGVPRG